MRSIVYKVPSLLLTVLLSAVVSGQSATTRLRTDGFYFYDNGIDTLNAIPDGAQMQAETVESMRKMGFLENNERAPVFDSIAINSEGSTYISFIAFYNDKGGMAWASALRNSKVLDTFLQIYERRKEMFPASKLDETVAMSDIYFQNDSVFTYIIGGKHDYFASAYTCTLRGNNLIVKQVRKAIPDHKYPVLEYTFIPFDNIPPDLILKKHATK